MRAGRQSGFASVKLPESNEGRRWP